ncbi:CotH kinase family protein [Algoriphagus chordae]|uniref:CotH protein n=1 Tax=Algoriphagus chordae TaxID=237019 RepID=A0A2W7RAU6_9BACT|nr:CotH kinase family protein [Algoriphagus chordae]PZX58203.1 CotH protein [Algoriphagus chordae]
MFQLAPSKPLSYLYLFTLLLFASCHENENTPDVNDNSLLFKSFVFEKSNNPELEEDIVFTIQDDVVNGEIRSYNYNLIPTFTSNAVAVQINGKEQTSGKNTVDFRESVIYKLQSASGSIKEYKININWDTQLAQVKIKTSSGASITSKEDYLEGSVSFEGQSKYDDLTSTGKFKGRGNTTWGLPKKPYKIKLDSKEEVFGLKPEKDWVLLANYLDGTHLLNAVAMKIGQLLDMPFTNTMIPVEVTINEEYLGLYMLTEQVEVKTNRVDVDDAGILLNLDTNYDEEWQFKSKGFALPVTLKYPEPEDVTGFTVVKDQFESLEEVIASEDFPNTDYLDYIDANSIANYIIVYMLTDNQEINHPKSTYIHKASTGKFTMGPIWDFDWAFGYEGTQEHFSRYNTPIFWSSPAKGTQFFSKFLKDPKIKALMKENWTNFQANNFNELLDYIDEYAFIIQGAKNRDYQVWNRNGADVKTLKNWLDNRATYMTGFINNL